MARKGNIPAPGKAFTAKLSKRGSVPGICRKRIMLVDDHPMTRAGLAQLINKHPELEVCCEAGDTAEALRHMGHGKPDLILTDITMPGPSGIDFVKDLAAVEARVPILVVSMHDELIYAERALRAGARGYIMKEAGGQNLLAAIDCVLKGKVYVSERISAGLLDSLTGRHPRGSRTPIEKLSDREFEIFQRIGQGGTTHEIAKQLHLSPKTVDVHRAHLKEKLGFKNATALLRYAVRWTESCSG